jgi:hypothetical protein
MHLETESRGCGWKRRANCTAAALRRRLSSLSLSFNDVPDRLTGAGALGTCETFET